MRTVEKDKSLSFLSAMLMRPAWTKKTFNTILLLWGILSLLITVVPVMIIESRVINQVGTFLEVHFFFSVRHKNFSNYVNYIVENK